MADKNAKQPENSPGKWYVDDTCVPCHVCHDEAPDLLSYAKDESHTYFQRQPKDAGEETKARNAMEACPTNAIGDDG